MDHLSTVINESFHDSEIAKKFSCKRTKAAAIAYNVLGKNFENKMYEELASGLPTFSIIIDESTDISNIKTLAIAIKFYSNCTNSIKTKFLCMVDIEGETSQHLFDALNGALVDRGLDLQAIIGFAADTTNVMFGENSGIVTKIKEVNPHCVFVKCVCHSVALAVSYACKILPRSIEQMVREVYNYFSQSSKRLREFKEIQNFTDTEQHKILKHYDIRWLSFHACVNRILEQWSPLMLFFQSQYLEDIKQNPSCEFLFNCFNDNIIKLYFYFLDFILPIVNKFNTIFQGDYPVVHRLHKDMCSMYCSILSCYMKSSYIKTTPPSNLDPKASMHFLPKNEMYLGINVAKHLDIKKGQIHKDKINDFFNRCQLFLIELSEQIRSRLPLQNDLFKEMSFLDPHVAVYSEFVSLDPLLSKFPNLVPENMKQSIDNEYRELKLDSDVPNLLASGSSSTSSNVETFWVNISKISDSDKNLKYKNLSTFAKHILCLPVSNAKCERIFSDVNRIKTKDRNRFINKNVSSIVHAKEGLRDINGCSSFNPDENFIKSMDDKQMYNNINKNFVEDD